MLGMNHVYEVDDLHFDSGGVICSENNESIDAINITADLRR